jgi:hypothetical protein
MTEEVAEKAIRRSFGSPAVFAGLKNLLSFSTLGVTSRSLAALRVCDFMLLSQKAMLRTNNSSCAKTAKNQKRHNLSG